MLHNGTTTHGSLTPADVAALERESWIDSATADAFGLRRVSSAEGAALVGRENREDYAGIAFSVYWPGNSEIREVFLRRDHPPIENGKPKQKYLAPPGRSNMLLFGPGESAEALTDPTIPIVLVEGLKKLLATHRLARHDSEHPRFLACAISGVWNWKGTIGKTVDPSGARVDLKGIIPDIERINWAAQQVFIAHDSDALTNPSVSAAREQLAEELRSRGAHVTVLFIPDLDGLPKTGFDDLLAAWGPERVLSWIDEARTQSASVQDDPEPIPLDAYDLPTVPIGEIPASSFRDMVIATSAATESPVELSLLCALGVIAASVQRRYVIEPEPGYVEPLNIWAVPALDSGNRKSAVVAHTVEPLYAFEREEAARQAPEIARAEAVLRLAEDRIKHLRQKAARAEGTQYDSLRQELMELERSLPQVPKALRLTAQDVTPEKLGSLMADHEERLAIISDEGGIFDILGGRYSGGLPNLDLFLQSYSGSPVRVDRGSRPPVFMVKPALTIIVSPQPSVLRGFASTPEFKGRGLLARPLYALPKSALGSRTLVPCPIPSAVRQAYRTRVHALLSLPPRPDGEPQVLRFLDGAYASWKAFQRHVERELGAGGVFEHAHVKDWAAKLPGNIARVAGLLHCAEDAIEPPETRPISLETTEAALMLGGIFERHALAALGLMSVTSGLEGAQLVWAWIERNRHRTFTRRDCHHALQAAFPTLDNLLPALAVLVERGYVFPVQSNKRVGRPSHGFRVNSNLTEAWR